MARLAQAHRGLDDEAAERCEGLRRKAAVGFGQYVLLVAAGLTAEEQSGFAGLSETLQLLRTHA